MNIMFWVTEKCNLNCDYCYVKKQPKTMSTETAEAAFKYFKKVLSERTLQTGEIHVGFHGGEPLLNFGVIQYLTEKFKEEYGDKVRYFSLTTNGTIFNEVMFRYLIENIELSVSIDGKRGTNDLRRHYSDGRSPYNETLRTLDFIKANDTPCRVRMTVNQQTMDTFSENYIYLDKKGYGTVTYAINTDDIWDTESIKSYSHQLESIMDYFIEEKLKEGKYFLYNLKECNFRPRSNCDGGTTNFHVSPNGDLYPCIMAMDDSEFLLGNIYDGINESAFKRLQEMNEKPVVGCKKCNFQKHCASQVCKIINKKATGNYYMAPAVACEERAVFYNLYKKYEHVLEGFDA